MKKEYNFREAPLEGLIYELVIPAADLSRTFDAHPQIRCNNISLISVTLSSEVARKLGSYGIEAM